MVREESIGESDFRPLVRLVGQVCQVGGSRAIRRRVLLQGLCGLIGARHWRTGVVEGDEAIKRLSAGAEGVGPAGVSSDGNGNRARVLGGGERSATDAPNGWHEGPIVLRGGLWIGDRSEPGPKPGGGPGREADRLLCLRPLTNGRWSCIEFARERAKGRFARRDLELVRAVNDQIRWLHEVDVQEAGGPGGYGKGVEGTLTPRLRQVLVLAVAGRSRRQIADGLELSPYTIRDYLSTLYRHFGVSSQPELMRLLKSGATTATATPTVSKNEPHR